MKKEIIALLVFFPSLLLQAQIGVNTEDPKATMHILPSSTGATTAEGFIAPNLTRTQLIDKESKYGFDQKGAIVYVTDLTGTLQFQTAKVTAVGYYYFDGNAWQPFNHGVAIPTVPDRPLKVQGTSDQATANSDNIYQQGKLAIGTDNTDPVSAYTLDIKGTSNVSGNSRVEANSTVVTNQTVGGTLGVTDAATLASSLTVAGISNLNGITNTKATNISGQLNYKPGGVTPVANAYLNTDATGNASWVTLPITATTEPWQIQGGTALALTNAQAIYQTGSVAIGKNTVDGYMFQVTGTSNVTANSRVGSSTIVGNQTVGTTLGVTGTSRLLGNVGVGGAPVLGTALEVTGNEHITGITKIGTKNTDVPAAQLNLADDDKGLLANRVALIDPILAAPVTGVVDGIMVYNTATVADKGLTPGFYYWLVNSWKRLIDVEPVASTVNTRWLQGEDTPASKLLRTSITTNGYTVISGRPLDFGELIIPADGSYAFSLRLYGTILPKPGNPPTQAPTGTTIGYYAGLVNETTNKIIDAVEMDIVKGKSANVNPAYYAVSVVATYTVNLGGVFKKGDKVGFRLANSSGSIYPWELRAYPDQSTVRTDCTTMIWWKL